MIRADLDGSRILVCADAEGAPIAAALPGATRTPKMPPLTWHMLLNAESVALLRGVHARASAELIAAAKALLERQRYVEEQKRPGPAEPLRPIPVKPGVQLYNHQIKAYNIVLALYGYKPAQGGGVQ